MNDSAFLDTNIIIYLFSEDENEKRDMAYHVVNSNTCITSTQTLNEACNVWIKKYHLSESQVIEYLDGIESICDKILPIQRKTINQAINICHRYKYSYFDCLMLASALEGNCSIIFTEDMQDRQEINDQLTIINPFNQRS